MADNVAITAGAGVTVASDELLINAVSAQVQRMKQVLGADGTYVGDMSGRLVSGSDGAAYVDQRAKHYRQAVTPVISTTVYAAKDAVGGLMEWTSAARFSGGSLRLDAIEIVDKDQLYPNLDLILFDRSITAPTDNAVFAPTDTEASQIVAAIAIGKGGSYDFSTNGVYEVPVGKTLSLNGTSVFGVLVARDTPTFLSTSSLVVALNGYQD